MNFVAFDTETTGFLAGVDQIVEVGAIKFIDGKEESLFCTLVNPKRPIPMESTKITGITDEMVADKPTIDLLLEPLAQFCGDLPIVAHNAPFDFQFLTADIKKYEGLSPRGFVLDSCAMARKVIPGLMNYKLGTLVQHLKIPSSGFHRAQADASYCGQLFLEIVKRLSSAGKAVELEVLISLSANAPLKFPVVERQPKQLDLLMDLGI